MLILAAKKYIGQREVAGPGVSAWLKALWFGLPGGKWFWQTYGSDDSKLPWCGAFIARVCQDIKLPLPAKFASASAWAGWGHKVDRPYTGCVAVLSRSGGGHVGIVTGRSADYKFIRLLGGNQGDAVSESWFVADRAIAYRAPTSEYPLKTTVAAVGTMSKSEA